ncbi:MAG: outer membrane beta-barrel protein [Acidobacteriota bacterium]|nr:MAG: outer membrane beta-barrel protein [Acidobacteriota bacterium]
MQRLVMILALLIFLPAVAAAQETPDVEIFGGYSYLRQNDNLIGEDLHGWNASFTSNLTRWLGLAADFSGHYGDATLTPGLNADVATHLFAVGPRFSYRGAEAVTPFAHVLLGAARSDVTYFIATGRTRFNESAFALIIGGGLDVKVHENIAIRLFQADYVLTRFNSDNQHNFRASTGVVVRLGEK